MYPSAPTSAADQSPGPEAGTIRATAALSVASCPDESGPCVRGVAPRSSWGGTATAIAPAMPARPAFVSACLRVSARSLIDQPTQPRGESVRIRAGCAARLLSAGGRGSLGAPDP